MKPPFTIYDLRFAICRKSAGGTGVAPVKSGVAPDLDRGRAASAYNLQSGFASRKGLGRDARNNRRDACSTGLVFNRQFRRGFTLVEMLVVISILGLLAALTVPALKNLGKSNAAISASRQMLDAVGAARQKAIAHHATVYLIFVPTNFWVVQGQFPNYWWTRLSPVQQAVATNLCDKQLSGYTFVAYGAAGDQPGRHLWHYLDQWQGLPEGSFIAQWKFGPRFSTNTVVDPATGARYPVQGFDRTPIPFPTKDFPNALALPLLPPLPYIAFNYLGQLTSGQDEYIPLARGSVQPAIDPSTKAFQFNSPSVSETPSGNSVSAFNLVHIDWLTGRADLRFQKVQ